MADIATHGAPFPAPDWKGRSERFVTLIGELREHLAGAERVAQQIGNSEFAVFGRHPMWIALEQMRGGILATLRGWNLAIWFNEEYLRECEEELKRGQESHRDHTGRADVSAEASRRHGLLDKLTRRGRRKG